MRYWNVTDDGPPATAAEDKQPSSSTTPVDGDRPSATSTSTATVATAGEDSNTDNTAKDEEVDNTSSDATVVANQQSQINIIPELPDATSNAFTQMVCIQEHIPYLLE